MVPTISVTLLIFSIFAIGGTETPVIGVISQTLEVEMHNDTRFSEYNSYIMKSYVDWIEAQGARVVPLIVDEDRNATLDKLKRMNGVLFPGGDGNYSSFGRFVFDTVK
jgi:gamma-glutamyl hydrolase